MVNYAKSIGLKPIYATTAKDSKELIQDGVTKKISIFKHIRFREY